VSSRIDGQVRAIVDHCYTNAKRIMQDHRALIDRLVDLLVERETIDGDELRQIVSEYTVVPDKQQFVPQL
jgi:cell division protease FtsH